VQIVNLETAIYLQKLQSDTNARRTRQRILLPLRVGINVAMEYVTTNDTMTDARELVRNAFSTNDKEETFIQRLKLSNPTAFGTVTKLAVFVDGQATSNGNNDNPTNVSPINDDPTKNKDTDVHLWIILVAAIGGAVSVVAFLIVILVVVRRRSSNSNHRHKQTNNSNNNSHQYKPNNNNNNKNSHHQQYKPNSHKPTQKTSSMIKKKVAYNTMANDNNNNDGTNNDMEEAMLQFAAEIRLENRADDVSTLGDPVGLPATQYTGLQQPQQHVRDERTASVGADYDYAKQHGMMGQRLSSSDHDGLDPFRAHTLGPMTGGVYVSEDEQSFEQQFELLDTERKLVFQVPPGKLGMVIDTPDDSPPLVHAIKPGSVLDGKVQVGDLLITVDDRNVTDWSAVQVSKLISARSDQQRTLVFLRPTRQRAESSVYLDDIDKSV
jgi:Protocadherin